MNGLSRRQNTKKIKAKMNPHNRKYPMDNHLDHPFRKSFKRALLDPSYPYGTLVHKFFKSVVGRFMEYDELKRCLFSVKYKTVIMERLVRNFQSFQRLVQVNDVTNRLSQNDAANIQRYFCKISSAGNFFRTIRKNYRGYDIIIPIFSVSHAFAINVEADGDMILFDSTGG